MSTEETIAKILQRTEEYYNIELNNYIAKIEDQAMEEMLSDNGYLREKIVQWIQIGISESVYGLYTPRMYKRRKFVQGGGGIGDPDNIITEYNAKTRTIEVKDIAEGNEDYRPTDGLLEPIILSGVGYHYEETGTGYFAVERNFYEKYDEEFGNGKFLMDILKPIVNKKLNKKDFKTSLYLSCLAKAFKELWKKKS